MKTKIMTMAVAAFLSFAIISTIAIANENSGVKAGTDADIWESKDWSKELTDCGKPVCKKEFVHYVKNGNNPAKSPTCYKLMGVKWANLPVIYVINPTNDDGISSSDIKNAIFASAETWDAATSNELFSNVYALNENAVAGTRNSENDISWGNYGQSGVIAVTTTWYMPKLKQILEFDILMDTDFDWATTGDPSKMDVQNIATHEIGHGLGLSDIYNSACSDVTMYGYSKNGDIAKRDLAQPDITGLQKMYGI